METLRIDENAQRQCSTIIVVGPGLNLREKWWERKPLKRQRRSSQKPSEEIRRGSVKEANKWSCPERRNHRVRNSERSAMGKTSSGVAIGILLMTLEKLFPVKW